MVNTCCASGCKHNNAKNTCRFFGFPPEGRERKKWIKLIRRVGNPKKNWRLCSCHFPDGKKENGPQLFAYNESTLFKAHHLTPEHKKGRKRKCPEEQVGSSDTQRGRKLVYDECQPSTSQEQPAEEKQLVPTVQPDKYSEVLHEAEMYFVKRDIEEKDLLIKTLKCHFSYENIANSDKLILEYTGLPERKIFEALYHLIEDLEINYYLQWKVQKLSRIDQLLLTLMKLRQNFPYVDLGYRFQISEGTVTNIMVTFVHVLHEVLFNTLMKNIPPREKNRTCLPNCASSFTNCRIIIDATEVFCAVPRKSMKVQRLTYSSYKHRNTFKGLVGVAPNGVVTYLSSLYPGSTSDKEVVKHCGILTQLEVGDLVLADKGFLIKDILPDGVQLNIPPFLCTPQFTPEQVQRTECIARARIHVERAICRMKSYKILNFIPDKLFNYSSIIFQTVGALTNFQYPLIKEVSDFFEQ